MKWIASVLSLLTLSAALGCGGPTPVPVSGVVTRGEKPIPNVNVTFLGGGGAVATGVTDAQGQFSKLNPNCPGEGAVPGEYKITITPKTDVSADPSGPISYDMVSAPPFPTKYMSLETTDLTATVEAGAENKFTFDLKD